MLGNLWVVLSHSDIRDGNLMLREYRETIPITPSRLTQAWITMIGLDSTSTNNSSYVRGPSRFGWSWNTKQCLYVVPAHDASIVDTLMLWECCGTISTPLSRLTHAWVTMVCLASTSTNYSPPVSGLKDPRFGLFWIAGQSMSGDRTRWGRGRCCDTMRVLWGCYHTSGKATTGMCSNGWHCLYLN